MASRHGRTVSRGIVLGVEDNGVAGAEPGNAIGNGPARGRRLPSPVCRARAGPAKPGDRARLRLKDGLQDLFWPLAFALLSWDIRFLVLPWKRFLALAKHVEKRLAKLAGLDISDAIDVF